MEIKFKCMRCNGEHDDIEDAAYCCAQIQRVAVCGECGFKTMSPYEASKHKCEDRANEN